MHAALQTISKKLLGDCVDMNVVVFQLLQPELGSGYFTMDTKGPWGKKSALFQGRLDMNMTARSM